MGSGHILVYAFDLLMQIYESAGYGQRDAARSILENNLYGLDIDDRAFQMAYFAVMMKARQYNRRILNGEYKPNVYSIQESNGINRNHLKYFGASLNDFEKNNALAQITGLLDTFRDAKEYGSILTVDQCDWDLLARFASKIETIGQLNFETIGLDETAERLKQMISQGKALGQKYLTLITNPPYMGSGSMNAKLTSFVSKTFPTAKYDLYSCCMLKGFEMLDKLGLMSMITMETWMFIASFERFREDLISSHSIVNLTHMPYIGKGGTSLGINFGTDVAVFSKRIIEQYNARYTYIRYFETDQEGVPLSFPVKNERMSVSNSNRFEEIPGKPIAYWVNDAVCNAYKQSTISHYMECKSGIMTGSDTYIKIWYEVDINDIKFNCLSEKDMRDYKWFPLNSGGDFRYYYGNNSKIVELQNEGAKIRRNVKNYRLRERSYYFKPGITWGRITSSKIAFRETARGTLFGDAGPVGFIDSHRRYVLGFLCSKVALYFLEALNPTVNYQVRDIENLPLIIDYEKEQYVEDIVSRCIEIEKADWNEREDSWEFECNTLIAYVKGQNGLIEEGYKILEHACLDRYRELEQNEILLNEFFISLYGLEKELTPEVEERDITILKPSANREIKRLLSYAVGCMFGRYSANQSGIVYAGGAWAKPQFEGFLPDDDNVIPITDEEYLEDDIVSRLCLWLKITFGDNTLERNLDYIASKLGKSGNGSREIIRNYFIDDFFKDHCTSYTITGAGRRPIYWLFDSGKQNGFKALIYLHRYNADTIGNLRIDYLHRMQRIYESEISRMQDMIDHSTSGREVAQATKRREKLTKQLKECREYDEKLAHLALSRIELDLDDGVKKNYRKIQTANDGKFYEVLADSKNIMSKE